MTVADAIVRGGDEFEGSGIVFGEEFEKATKFVEGDVVGVVYLDGWGEPEEALRREYEDTFDIGI